MSFEDRYYQTEAVTAIHSEWEQGRRGTLLVLPTGAGKTICFARLIESLVRKNARVLILAHRGELLDQAADKIYRVTGLKCAVEKAEQTCIGDWFRVVVGSVQTLMNEKRLCEFPKDYFSHIIIDEAHHAVSDSYRRVIDYFYDAKLLGVTATPDRGDMRNLSEVFDSLAYEYSLPKAIRDGYLCKIKALSTPVQIDLSGVKSQAGDYQAKSLGHALDPYLEDIAEQMRLHCQGRRTLVFLPLIATSQKFCEILKDKGFNAVEINGESSDRAEKLAAFQEGQYDVCCNSMLLTEGFDCPPIDCIVPLRATKIRSLYSQMIGRGTRIYPGKDHLLILDFLWLTSKMDLCRPAHLIAENDNVANKMTANIDDADSAVDLEEAETQAESDCIQEREEALAKKLAENRKKKAQLVDPLQFEISISAEDLSDYVPSFGWEMKLPSEEQKEQLEKAGINSEGIECAGKAKLVLDKLQSRRANGLSTPKQIRFLERKGFQHVGTWQFENAKKLIDRIAAQGWRVPRGIDPKTYNPENKGE